MHAARRYFAFAAGATRCHMPPYAYVAAPVRACRASAIYYIEFTPADARYAMRAEDFTMPPLLICHAAIIAALRRAIAALLLYGYAEAMMPCCFDCCYVYATPR